MSFPLPVPAGASSESLDDPLLTGLLGYVAAWLNWGLSAKLASMDGLPDEAAPSGNLYPYEPGREYVRLGLPALYMWRDGAPRQSPFTVYQTKTQFTVKAKYIFSERVWPLGIRSVAGLNGAIRQLLTDATIKRQHADYDSGGYPIDDHLGFSEWQMGALNFGAYLQVPGQIGLGPSSPRGTDGSVVRGHPFAECSWLITEHTSVELKTAAEKVTYLGSEVDVDEVVDGVKNDTIFDREVDADA